MILDSSHLNSLNDDFLILAARAEFDCSYQKLLTTKVSAHCVFFVALSITTYPGILHYQTSHWCVLSVAIYSPYKTTKFDYIGNELIISKKIPRMKSLKVNKHYFIHFSLVLMKFSLRSRFFFLKFMIILWHYK